MVPAEKRGEFENLSLNEQLYGRKFNESGHLIESIDGRQ